MTWKLKHLFNTPARKKRDQVVTELSKSSNFFFFSLLYLVYTECNPVCSERVRTIIKNFDNKMVFFEMQLLFGQNTALSLTKKQYFNLIFLDQFTKKGEFDKELWIKLTYTFKVLEVPIIELPLLDVFHVMYEIFEEISEDLSKYKYECLSFYLDKRKIKYV